jgi:multidrug transporter EmrE-like cation transporter
MTQISLLILFAVLLSMGQVLFKLVAQTSDPLDNMSNIIGLAGNIWFYASIFCYGLSTLLWIYILQKLPLSYAYPFVAIGFILVPILSHFIFGETLKPQYFLGIAFIVIGIITISATGR